jgi:hypothetical protein
MSAQDDDTRAFERVGDLARRQDAVDSRHAHIHEHHVGSKGRGKRDSFGAVGGPADDDQVGLVGERFFEAEGKEVVIVCDQNLDRPWFIGQD